PTGPSTNTSAASSPSSTSHPPTAPTGGSPPSCTTWTTPTAGRDSAEQDDARLGGSRPGEPIIGDPGQPPDQKLPLGVVAGQIHGFPVRDDGLAGPAEAGKEIRLDRRQVLVIREPAVLGQLLDLPQGRPGPGNLGHGDRAVQRDDRRRPDRQQGVVE